jgi:hypothetical protein
VNPGQLVTREYSDLTIIGSTDSGITQNSYGNVVGCAGSGRCRPIKPECDKMLHRRPS